MKLQLTKKSSGLDRFGFFYWFKKELGVPFFYNSKTDWEHGWQFNEFDCKNLTKYKWWLNRRMHQVVSSNKKKELIKSYGHKNTHVAPYPFFFFNNGFLKKKFLKKNNNDCLLVIPNKIQPFTEVEEEKRRILKYLTFIDNYKNDFEKISVSIPPDEKGHEIWQYIINKLKFDYIDGISPFDQNAYYRTIELFNNFEYITSDCIGSHALYSQLMKKKFSICHPPNEIRRYHQKLNIPQNCPVRAKDVVRDMEYSFSIDYLKSRYFFLIKDNPKKGFFDFDWALKTIGDNKDITKEQIREILGLNIIGQIKYYINKII